MKEKIKNVVVEVGKDPKKTFVVGTFVGSTVMFIAGLIDRAVMKKKAECAVSDALQFGMVIGELKTNISNSIAEEEAKETEKTEE